MRERAYDSAIRNFATAARFEPEDFGLQLNLARAQLAIGDPEAARGAIANARLLNPNSPDLAVLEITLFTSGGDYLRAENLLETLEKTGFDRHRQLTLLGELRTAQGRFADAGQAYKAAYALEPSQRLASRALQTAQQAYRLELDSGGIADTLGWIHLRSGNLESALELLSKAAAAAPENPEIQYHLAVAHQESGDPESAKKILSDLVESNVKFPSRKAAEETLAKL
jgi:tetratricopeptide (TPR) repeat protein